jgi:cytochrome c peroxidase
VECCTNRDLGGKMESRFYSFGFFAVTIMTVLLCLGCGETSKMSEEESFDLGFLMNNKDLQLFGEKLFFDKSLSDPEGQSCSSCHGPEAGWTGPDEGVNKTGGVYPGAKHQRYGNRKPNSSAYATLSPLFSATKEDGQVIFFGGNFWDGRAMGYKLGNPAADQAQGPFLNPLEHNISDAKTVVGKVIRSDYASLFTKVGKEIWRNEDICKSNDVNLQFGIIGIAIAAYENSEKVNQFSSKFDYYLKKKVTLTEKEAKGLELFDGKAKCSLCHLIKAGTNSSLPVFTDFRFENVGIPRNPMNPWYSMDSTFNKEGVNWIDNGLSDFLKEMPQYAMFAAENYGKHQVPTLRNVDKRPSRGFIKAYGHNGYFKSLEDVVHFYNTRDVLPFSEAVSDPQPGLNCWPKPEVSQNINKVETGNLRLTREEESAIVEFLKTLSDGYTVNQK